MMHGQANIKHTQNFGEEPHCNRDSPGPNVGLVKGYPESGMSAFYSASWCKLSPHLTQQVSSTGNV